MLDYVITKDDKSDDTDYHKRIRTQIEEPNQQMTGILPQMTSCIQPGCYIRYYQTQFWNVFG
jgi:hypothetical protein